MKKIKQRSSEEIMKELREKAHSYTPEWRFSKQLPDIGTALATVYSGMQERLDRKYGMLPDKLKIDYFNCLNTSMKSAAPAEGFVVFGLSGDGVGSSFLPEGTPLRGDTADESGEPVPVELKDDVLVVQDTLAAIYETRGAKDYIGLLYQPDEEEEKQGFSLFGMSAENLERHLFRISHPFLLHLNGHGIIGLRFYDEHGALLPEETVSRLADPRAARFYYETGEEEGGEYLTDVRYQNGTLWIRKQIGEPPWAETEHFGILTRWLCCEVLDIRGLEDLSPARIAMSAGCAGSSPDGIFGAGTDQPPEEPFMPFGERFSIYDDVYFGAEDALSKKGAVVELSFQEEFIRIPIRDPDEDDGFEWKLVMPKDQFTQKKEYDITIEEVIWEYYNGSGWGRLFKSHEYVDAFSAARGADRQLRKVTFTCPQDLVPVLAGSAENYYIRARVLKVNNAYKNYGYYVTPVVSDVRFTWKYAGEGLEPEYMTASNHLEETLVSVRRERLEGRKLVPLKGAEDNRPALWMGFKKTFTEGPVRILWETEQTMQEIQPDIHWEYYRRSGWAPLMPLDGTEDFRMTGLLTFGGIPDAAPLQIFGQEEPLYWIRAVQTENTPHRREMPYIRGWYLNGARAVTLRHGLSEYWTMENWETDATIQLLNRNIHKLELWVREDERLSSEEIRVLTRENRYEQVLDETGGQSYAWIRWEQTDNIQRHDPGDRVYMLDENEGILSFGGGAAGKVPAPGVVDGIHAVYSIGGGRKSNLAPGSVTALELAEGYVSSVTNPLPMTGGYDRETAAQAIRRAAAESKHRFRAVTESDFEELAVNKEASIRRVKCLTGVDAAGSEAPGEVTLVILTDDYNDRGAGFERLKSRLYQWFQDKLPAAYAGSERFHIRRAELVEIELHVEAVITDYQRMFRIQKDLQDRLTQFLDPVSGNFNGGGWEIGQLPERSQLEALIRSSEYVESLRRCTVFTRIVSRTGSPAVSYDEIRNMPFVLPVGGIHQFRMERKNSRGM